MAELGNETQVNQSEKLSASSSFQVIIAYVQIFMLSDQKASINAVISGNTRRGM